MRTKALVLVAIGVMAIAVGQARAAVVYSGSNSSGLNFTASFTLTPGGELEMTVTNNSTSSTTIGNFISGIYFTIGGNLGSNASALKFVEVSGTRTDFDGTSVPFDLTGNPPSQAGSAGESASSASTNWALTTVASQLQNDATGGGKPWDMIGPTSLTSSSSVPGGNSGGSNHFPDFLGSASFFYSETNGSALSLLTSSSITALTFYYGTGPDGSLPGTLTSGGGTSGTGVQPSVPEPASFIIWSVFGCLAIGLGWLQTRKSFSRALNHRLATAGIPCGGCTGQATAGSDASPPA